MSRWQATAAALLLLFGLWFLVGYLGGDEDDFPDRLVEEYSPEDVVAIQLLRSSEVEGGGVREGGDGVQDGEMEESGEGDDGMEGANGREGEQEREFRYRRNEEEDAWVYGPWLMVHPFAYQASRPDINVFLRRIMETPPNRIFDDADLESDEYGLNDPLVVLDLEFEDGRSREIRIGQAVPVNRHLEGAPFYYGSISGDERLFTLKWEAVEHLLSPDRVLLPDRVFSITINRFQRVEFVSLDGVVRIERGDDGRYRWALSAEEFDEEVSGLTLDDVRPGLGGMIRLQSEEILIDEALEWMGAEDPDQYMEDFGIPLAALSVDFSDGERSYGRAEVRFIMSMTEVERRLEEIAAEEGAGEMDAGEIANDLVENIYVFANFDDRRLIYRITPQELTALRTELITVGLEHLEEESGGE